MSRHAPVALRLLLVVGALLLSPSASLANAGPAEWAADGYGGTLVPVKNDSVAVLGEHLTIDLSKIAAPVEKASVPIRATYRIRNESGTPQVVLLAFPYWTWRQGSNPTEGFEAGFRATLDGTSLKVMKADIDIALESALAGDGMLRDLRTRAGEGGQSLRQFRWPWALRSVAFEVDLSPGDERTLG